jgi:adenylate kinase
MTDRAPDLIIIGPPGSGKSTLAGRLADKLGFVHLNPGTLLRRIAAEDSTTGQQVRSLMADGALVPDDVIDELVRQRLSAVPPEQGLILDGYPRTAAQAETLRRFLAESGRLRRRPLALRLDVRRDRLLERLRRRREAEGRGDDADDVARRRLQIYDAEAARILDAVAGWADVVAIDGDGQVDAVTAAALAALDARRDREA